MTKFRFAAFAFLIAIVFSVSTFAQPAAAAKIGFINSEAFYDEKAGVTKLINALKQLEREFAPKNQELTGLNTRLGTISTELQNMQKLPPAQFNQVAYNTKREEGENLKRKFDYEKTVAENDVAKRRAALIGPISQEIGKAIDEYAQKNGFSVILDPSNLSVAMIHYAEGADSTKDFIAFFNAITQAIPAAATPR